MGARVRSTLNNLWKWPSVGMRPRDPTGDFFRFFHVCGGQLEICYKLDKIGGSRSWVRT